MKSAASCQVRVFVWLQAVPGVLALREPGAREAVRVADSVSVWLPSVSLRRASIEGTAGGCPIVAHRFWRAL